MFFSGTNNTSAAATINLNSNNYLYIAGGTAGLIIGDDALATAIQFNDASSMAFDIGGGTRAKLDANSRISLSNNDSGTQNTVFGHSAGANIDAGSNYNVFIGHNVGGGSLDDATENTGVGYSALANLTSGDRNTAIGRSAGLGITSGSENTLMGYLAGDSITTGLYNTAIGSQAF